MNELKVKLRLSPVIYVCRDIERALGFPLITKGYWIITNSGPLSKALSRKHKNVLTLASKDPLDTTDLLLHPKSATFLKKIKNPNIVVFKNTKQIEKICSEHKWNLLNPSAELANTVEQKITQIKWLGPLKKYLPPYKVMKCKELTWSLKTSLPVLSSAEARKNRRHLSSAEERWREVSQFIIQFNHAHTGLGTILIESPKQIEELKTKFPNREVRVLKYIDGPVFTNNNIVWKNKVLCGNINFQITGLSPFTDGPFVTVGNDWALPHKLLNNTQIKQYKQIVSDVGKRLLKDGWRGLFGIDVIMEKKTGKLFLLEINARQPASTTFESQLQKNIKTLKHKNNITTFEAHLAALLGLRAAGYALCEIADGAQIIQRVTESRIMNYKLRKAIVNLRASGFNVIQYNNTNPGEDLLRIQSVRGIMKVEKEFNEIGEKIKFIISHS